MMGPPLARLAWRNVAAQWRDALFFAACIFVGAAVLVGVAASGKALKSAVDADARAMLAADLRLQSAAPFDPIWTAQRLARPGWFVAPSRELTGMARDPSGERTVLVEIKAVTGDYPLRGAVLLQGGGAVAEVLAGGAVAVEGALLERLGLGVGQDLMLGDAAFPIGAVLAREPDRINALFSLGPRVILPLERLEETGLVQFGSRIKHVLSVRLPFGADSESIAAELEEAARGEGIRVIAPGGNRRMVRRFVKRLTLFLGLTGLASLLVGGLGIAAGVGTFLRENRVFIAVVKSLGGSNGLVMRLFFWQLLLLVMPPVLAGVVVGLLTPGVFLWALPGLIPAQGAYHPDPWLLLQGIAFGVGFALLFSAGPLFRTRQVLPGLLFRGGGWEADAGGGGLRRESWLVGLAVLLLAALFTSRLGEGRLALVFLAEFLAIAVGGWLFCRGALAVLGRLPGGGPAWSSAVAALRRPENSAVMTAAAMGLGFGLIMTTLLLRDNILGQISQGLPERAPSFYFIDLQEDQVDAFRRIAARFGGAPEAIDSDSREPTQSVELMPVIHGRLAAIDGAAITPEMIAAHPQHWRLTREYVMTRSAEPIPHNPLITGRWHAPGEVGVSVESGMAEALGLAVGDELTLEIQGIPITAPILSIRRVRWADLKLNFFLVFSPAALAGAPVSYLATVAAPPAREEALRQAVSTAFPNVSAIHSREVMETVGGLLDKLGLVVTVVGATAAASGALVLATLLAASRRRRLKESAIRRLLGATSRVLTRAALLELLLLGVLTATSALLVSQTMGYAAATLLLGDVWRFAPGLSLALWAGAVLWIVATGWLMVRQELRQRGWRDLFRG